MKQQTGFIGLGIMGAPMCRNLIRHGYTPLVFDINSAAVDEVVSHGARASSLPEIGETCGVIFTILPDGSVVRDVLFGEGGVAEFLSAGDLVVDMSSVAPTDSIECARRLKEIGVGFLDAPVSGGEPKAIDGTLAFMAGGEDKNFQRVIPYFDVMGSTATLVGPTGVGSVTKLANQVIVNLNIAAMSEALVFACAAGADPQRVYEAIRGGLAGSVVLDSKAPMIFERNFAPGGKISINHKDIANVLTTSHDIGIPMPFTAQLFEVMGYLKSRNCLEEDHSAIVKYFETLSGTIVQAENKESKGKK